MIAWIKKLFNPEIPPVSVCWNCADRKEFFASLDRAIDARGERDGHYRCPKCSAIWSTQFIPNEA